MSVQTMNDKTIPNKSEQAHFRMTRAQALALRQHCQRTRQSTSEAVLAGLAKLIEGFPTVDQQSAPPGSNEK